MKTKQDLVDILRNDPRAIGRFREPYLVDAFNRARKLRGTEDYDGLDLDSLSLHGLDMRVVNFENVLLTHATVNRANFEGANLRRAIFDNTNAMGTNFKNADLKGCFYLYKMFADGADFENADLRGAFLHTDYTRDLRLMFRTAHFSGTIITPEQQEQLMSDFKIPRDFLESRFRVLPRGRYLRGPNEYFYEKGLKAYEQARTEGSMFTEKFNGKTMEYAVIPLQGNEDIRDAAGWAFSLCEMDSFSVGLLGSQKSRYEGKWMYFVFDVVPELFREVAAVHEFGEREGGSHKEAMKMEYERAKSKGILHQYISWIKQQSPDALIQNYLLAKESGETLPNEVVEAVKDIMPQNIRTWKKHERETRKNSLPVDIWFLAWKGLSDVKIAERLGIKGYNATTDTVRYWREQMEIPRSQAIRKLTYLRPI